MNKKLIRKMQTAAGGPLRIKFTPEQIALFENQATRVPGMNNSGGNRYREEGVLALRHLEQEAKRKEEEIKSRMEMRPTLKRKATIAEKLRGKKDEYELRPLVVGMSGTDPVGEFILAGIGFNGIGALAKTGLWNVAKYAPTTQLGNWGRGYFVGNAFRNSFSGTIPTLTSQATSLLYQPIKLNEPGLTSLKFFEKPTLSNAQELAGATKWERNFKPKWHVANYPGYLLKGLMKGSLLEKQLSKNGTININQLNAYFNKASQLEREVVNKVLAEKFVGLKAIDYNLFKKAVLDELIGKYNRVPLTEWADYGIENLGYNLKTVGENELPGLPNLIILGLPVRYTPPGTTADPINLSTFTFESPRIPYGNTKHYGGNPIGHSRTYTLPEDPYTLYVMESQSDWALQALRKKGSINAQSAYERASQTAAKHLQEIELIKANLEKGLAPDGHKIQYEWEQRDIEEIIKNTEKQLASNNARAARFDAILHPEKYVLENYLKQNYLLRQLQENLRYAAENGLTKMRYPTRESAIKIEGYTPAKQPSLRELSDAVVQELKSSANAPTPYSLELFDLRQKLLKLTDLKEINRINSLINRIQKIEDRWKSGEITYPSDHETILDKYFDFPKLFLKLYKGLLVRIVTDAKGNTWYEADVPKGYLSREWQFKQGGKMNILEFLKNGSGIHIKKENRGKFTDYCGGKVTDECIRKAKASGNPTLVKRATFALNSRRWAKHKNGGLVIKAEEGTKTNFFNNPKFLLGLLIGINSLALLLGTYLNISTKDININELIPGIHYSEISLAPIIQEELYKLVLKEMKKLEDYVLNLLLELNISDKATLGTSFLNRIPEFINTGFHFYNTLKNYKLSSGINETSKLLTKKINFWDNPTITNSIDLNFWTNPTILNSKKNENNPYF